MATTKDNLEAKTAEESKPKTRKPRTITTVTSTEPKRTIKKAAAKPVEPKEIENIDDLADALGTTAEEIVEEEAVEVSPEPKGLPAEESKAYAEENYKNASDAVEYSANGIIQAPGYFQGWEGRYGRINVFAWLGFIFTFLFFPLGLAFSWVGIVNANRVPDDKFHRVLSYIGFGLSAFLAFMMIIPMIIALLAALVYGFTSFMPSF